MLLQNERHERELPGGRIETSANRREYLIHEFAACAGLNSGAMLDHCLFGMTLRRHAFIVTNGSRPLEADLPKISAEYLQMGRFDIADLPVNVPPCHQRSFLTWCARLGPAVDSAAICAQDCTRSPSGTQASR